MTKQVPRSDLILDAWSAVLEDPSITEITAGRVWAVTTAAGDRYFLKQVSTFNACDPQARFRDEVRILTHLREQGVPVALPVVSDSGSAFATDDGHALYALLPMLPGDAPHQSRVRDDALYQKIGRAVAQLHLALEVCPFGINSWEVNPSLATTWWRAAEQRVGTDTSILEGPRRRWGSIVPTLSSARMQRVHGDIHDGNLLTDGSSITGILDCDHLPLAPRVYDLGYYVAFDVHQRLETSSRGPSAERASCFVTSNLMRGYRAVSGLAPHESESVPALAFVAAVSLIAYFVDTHDLLEESWLRTLIWIDENFEALLHAASDA